MRTLTTDEMDATSGGILPLLLATVILPAARKTAHAAARDIQSRLCEDLSGALRGFLNPSRICPAQG